MFDNLILKLLLGMILFSLIVFSAMSIPSADAASGKLTIRGESSTIYFNESVYYKGKLTDSEGYAISFERINIWEKVNGEWQYVTQGKTDARGEYRITIPANHWNYAKTVNIVANSASSIQSPSLSLTIEKPYSYQVKQQANNYVQTTPSNEIQSSTVTSQTSDRLTLQYKIRNIIVNQPVTFSGQLTDKKGWSISGADIALWEKDSPKSQLLGLATTDSNGKYQIKVIAKYWDGDGEEVEIFANSGLYGVVYSPTLTIDLKQSFYQATQNDATKIQSTKSNTNELSKSAIAAKSTYSEILSNVESGIKASEYAMSNSKLENSEAKKKIDAAWDFSWRMWQEHGDAKIEIDNAQNNIYSKQYDNSYKKLVNSESSIYKAKDHLYSVLDELKDARDVEKKYQESLRSCFLFWCDEIKNTYGELDSKIKNLESKLDNLESKTKTLETSKGSFTQSLHKNEISLKNQEIQNLEKVRNQEQVDSDRQESILQEQIRQEQYEAEDERQRLEEQKQRELREQQYQAEQERQRLQQLHNEELKRQALQRQLEQEAYERDLAYKEQQRQQQEDEKIRMIANKNPVLKGMLDGVITFYIAPIPNYADSNVSKMMDVLTQNLEAKSTSKIKFQRVYSSSNADISVNWVKDYEVHAGISIFKTYNIIGLGTNTCYGQWQPLDAATIYYIVWHEMGHSLGFNHSSDSGNVMYPTTPYYRHAVVLDNFYSIDEGQGKVLSLCGYGISGNGKFSYEISTNDKKNGFTAYVVPPSTNPSDFVHKNIGTYYKSCSTTQSMISFSGTCTVEQGSKLIIYNKNDLLKFNSIDVDVKIIDNTYRKEPSLYWNPSDFAYDEKSLKYLVDSYGR